MAIITISRGSLSGGKQLASCIGMNLGYQVISREELVSEAAAAYGVKEENLVRGLEKGPTFWDRFRIDRQIYLTVARATLCRLVSSGDVVYHGHAGHLLLEGVPHVIKIRIIAPMTRRVQAAMQEHGFGEGEAEAYIRRRDEERQSWTRFLYGIEWGDPVLYDLTVNLERLSIEAVCGILSGLVERPEQRVTKEARSTLANQYLAAHVKAKLYLNPKIAASAAKISVEASGGAVKLSGLLPGEVLVRSAVETVRGLPEVTALDSEWLAATAAGR